MFGGLTITRFSVPRVRSIIVLSAVLLAIQGCRREDRELNSPTAQSSDKGEVALVSIAPGPAPPQREASRTGQKYAGNAYHISEGKRMFSSFNCTGCHGHGGGASGPALMDDKWIYGGSIENIAATIREGRPNGMPSFRGRIPEEQIWQIAAYVRSMSGNGSKAARPGRDDDLFNGPPESSRKPEPQVNGGIIPPSAETP